MHTFLLLFLALGAQAPDATTGRVAWASTTDPTALADDPACSDAALLRFAEGGAGARLYLSDGGWNALLGDADGDLLFDLPPGVDALAHAPQPGASSATVSDLWFSSDADFQGWKDGDVLRIGPAGDLERVHAEDDLRAALGTSSSLDVDALERDASGLLWFSLRDGVSASALGAIEDGDVLVYDPAAGTAWRHASEAEVQAWVDHAAPGLGAIGDLKSLAFDPLSGELLFTVQSPSSDDASVYSVAGGGSLLAGFAESDWGFLAATELDALSLPAALLPEPPQLEADQSYLAQGQGFSMSIRRASPGARVFGLVGLRRLAPAAARGGFQLAVLDPAGPARAWPQGSAWIADAAGRATASLAAPSLPPGMSSAELVYQAFDSGGRGLSTPWIVRVQ